MKKEDAINFRIFTFDNGDSRSIDGYAEVCTQSDECPAKAGTGRVR